MKASKLSIKAILFTVLCALLIGVGAPPANAVGKQQYVVVYKADINFIVDGEVYHAPKETQGFLYNNRTYVPVRFASYMLEKHVNWNNATSTVSVTMPNATQLKQIKGYKKQYLAPNVDASKPVTNWSKQTIYTSVDVAGYNFFGKEQPVPKDVTTFLHNGTLYVPLRYFAELIQQDIKYDNATKSITMNARSDSEAGNGGGSTTEPGAGGEQPGGGEGTAPGVPGEVVPPTRSELIAATEAQLKRMETRLASQAYALANKYAKASSEEEKQQLELEAYEKLAEADVEVERIVGLLNQDLEKYDYEIGNDAEEFKKEYERKKEAMIAQMLNRF